jgi:hypothetical protein
MDRRGDAMTDDGGSARGKRNSRPVVPVAFPRRGSVMPTLSLKEELLLYLKNLRKRDARAEIQNAHPNDGYRAEGANIAYAKIVRELEALVNGKEMPAP